MVGIVLDGHSRGFGVAGIVAKGAIASKIETL